MNVLSFSVFFVLASDLCHSGGSLFSDLLGGSLHHPASAAGNDLVKGKIFQHVLLGDPARRQKAKGREGGAERLDGGKSTEIGAGEELDDLHAVGHGGNDLRGSHAAGKIGNGAVAADLSHLGREAGAHDEFCTAVNGAVAPKLGEVAFRPEGSVNTSLSKSLWSF